MYCKNCSECFNGDYFRTCNLCKLHFKTKEGCGYLCEDCDDQFRTIVTFEEDEYYLYVHKSCHKMFFDYTLNGKKELIDRHGVLVKKKE